MYKYLILFLVVSFCGSCVMEDSKPVDFDEELFSRDGRRIALSNVEYEQLSVKYSIPKILESYDRIIRGPAAQELISPGSTKPNCACGNNTPGEEVPNILVEPQDHIAGLTGRILFYDQRLSLSNELSCASCHKQRFSFADQLTQSHGENDLLTSNNTPSLAYQVNRDLVRGRKGQYANLKEAITLNLTDYMGNISIDEVLNRIGNDKDYQLLSGIKTGSEELTEKFILESLSTFIMSMTPFVSRADEYFMETGLSGYSQSEHSGKLFFDKNCSSCHTDNLANNTYKSNTGPDGKKYKATFLRNISNTAPYMHDGSLTTLDAVLDFYKDADILREPSSLTPENKRHIIAYLNTLDDINFKLDEKYSNPKI